MVEAAKTSAGPVPEVEKAAVLASTPAEPSVAEVRWDCLIEINGIGRTNESAPCRPPIRPGMWPLALAAVAILIAGLFALRTDGPSANNPRDATAVQPIAPNVKTAEKAIAPGNVPKSFPSAIEKPKEKIVVDKRLETALPNLLATPRVGAGGIVPEPNVSDISGRARGFELKTEMAAPLGGMHLPESILPAARIPKLAKLRSVKGEAVGTRKVPERQQLETAESRLVDAKARYARAKDLARERLLDAFERAIHNIDANRTISAVDRQTREAQLSKEKEQFAQDHRALPDTKPMIWPVFDYLSAIQSARDPLSNAYENLVELYERTDIPKAREFALEVNKLDDEFWKAQPLAKDSLWEGLLAADTIDSTRLSLRILERQDRDFEGEVVFNGGALKSRLSGHFNGLAIEWTVEAMPDEGGLRNWRFLGIVWHRRLLGYFSWTKTDDLGQPLLSGKGRIHLELRR